MADQLRKEQIITSSRTGFHYAWIILIIGVLVTFSSVGLARFGYTTVLPSMQDALGLDNTEAGGIATATMVGYLLPGRARRSPCRRAYGPRYS